jgi:DNA-binding transcriptional ArsR family regulator
MPVPSDLRPFRRHAEWAVVAATALELGVFDALAESPAHPGELAETLGLHPRGARVLLGGLEEMGLVRVEPGGRYRVTGPARGYLVDRDTPDYHADAVELWLRNLREWATALPEALRTGGPVDGEAGEGDGHVDGGAREGSVPRGAGKAGGGGDAGVSDREAMESFQAAMANKSPRLVEAVVDATLERAPESGRVLDLGGGPGTFSREFAERGYRALLFDRPEVVEHVAGAYRLEETPGIELRGGDFLEELPEGEFEVVFLANITHIFEGETNRSLLERTARRLAPGGVLAVMDFVRGHEPFAALFAFTMLLNTEAGDTYDLTAYRSWLEGAGLRDVRCRTVPEDRQVVTAVRPGG